MTDKRRNDLLHIVGLLGTLMAGYILGAVGESVWTFILCIICPAMVGYVRGKEVSYLRLMLAWYDENRSELIAHKIIKGGKASGDMGDSRHDR